jgi:hypothetical protein
LAFPNCPVMWSGVDGRRLLNRTVANGLKKTGMIFNDTDPSEFRNTLCKNGYYERWKETFGPEAGRYWRNSLTRGYDEMRALRELSALLRMRGDSPRRLTSVATKIVLRGTRLDPGARLGLERARSMKADCGSWRYFDGWAPRERFA